MTEEKKEEWKKQYGQHYAPRELFDEIRNMEQGDLWEGLESKRHKEERLLMIEVFSEMMKSYGVPWD